MSNYIPHYTKKKQVLARKELALERLIARGEPRQKVVAAAEEVRDARIRVLRARRATIVPRGDADTQFQKLDDRIQQLLSTSLDSILAEFGLSKAEEDTN